MVSGADDDWSDSDDMQSEVETRVLLGIPDGVIDSPEDLADAALSRIGGRPAFLPATEPSITSSHCKNCFYAMPLLVQMWCPFEDSPMDRALHVWGCPRGTCKGKEGREVVRAWRGLRYNCEYAAKLKKKQARTKSKQKGLAEFTPAPGVATTAKANPFSVNASVAQGAFGLGAQVFGGQSELDSTYAVAAEVCDHADDSSSSEDESSLIVALTSARLEDSPWLLAPSYTPLYLSTISEYIPPSPKSKLPIGPEIQEPVPGKKNKDVDSIGFETYENSLNVDPVFERFTKRVGYEGEQCVRYELKGTPLPFASDKVFSSLFPIPSPTLVSVTKSAFDVTPPAKRTYTTASIPPCPVCKSRRTFECQLMPNLINVLSSSEDTETSAANAEERRKVVGAALKMGSMEWGTCMVFSCEKDCCGDDSAEQPDCWREELVFVQWDD